MKSSAEKQSQPGSSAPTRAGRGGGSRGGRPDLLRLQAAAGNQAVEAFLAGDPGEPLEPGAGRVLSMLYGQDFSSVRVHHGPQAGEQARQQAARAFTHGEHIVFAPGGYAPGTPVGRRLLAHELAHVVQQRGYHGQLAQVANRSGDAHELAASAAANVVMAAAPAGQSDGMAALGVVPGAAGALATAAGGAPAAVQREDGPAPAAEKRSLEEQQAVMDEMTSSIISAFYSSPQNLQTGTMLTAAGILAKDVAEPPGPKTYFTSMRLLAQMQQELSQRESTAKRGPDNELMYETWGGDLVPWAKGAKALKEIPPFTPDNVELWKSALHQSSIADELNQALTSGQLNAGGSATAAPGQTAQAGSGGQAGASQQAAKAPPVKPPPATLITSTLGAPGAMPTEENDPTAMKADVSKGISALGAITVGQAVNGIRDSLLAMRKKENDPQQAIAIERDNKDLSLLKACGRIFYLGQQIYVLDRTGHIVSTDFSFELAATDLAPGGTYFFGSFAFGTAGSPYGSTNNMMLRVDGGTAQPTGGNVYVSRMLTSFVPATAHVSDAQKAGGGVGIIVASNYKARAEKAKDLNTDNMLKALRGAAGYMDWAVGAYVRSTLANWEDALLMQAVNIGVNKLSKLIPVVGQAKALYDLLVEEIWMLDMVNIAGRAVSEDEVNLVSQALAWKVAEWAVGKAAHAVVKGVAGAAKGVAGAAKSRGGSSPAGKVAPSSGGSAGGGNQAGGAGSEGSGSPSGKKSGSTGSPGEGGVVTMPKPAAQSGAGSEGSAPAAARPAANGGSDSPSNNVIPLRPKAAAGGDGAGGSSTAKPGTSSSGDGTPNNVIPFRPKAASGDGGGSSTAKPGAGDAGSAAAKPGANGATGEPKNNVIPFRPKGQKGSGDSNEPNTQVVPKRVLRDATTGLPIEDDSVTPQTGKKPGGANDQPSGVATQPGAVASANGQPPSGGGGNKPPSGGAQPPANGTSSGPTPTSAGGKKQGGKGGGGGKQTGEGGAANDNEQPAAVTAQKPAVARKFLFPTEKARRTADTGQMSDAEKARFNQLLDTVPEEKANPPKPGTPNRQLPDIRSRFNTVPKDNPDGSKSITTSGELGEPDKVRSTRSRYQQSKVSKHTGDDAGHRVGSDFGGPEGESNLARQNRIQNQGEGTFYALEGQWKASLKAGSRIFVQVTDHFKPNEDRPYKRTAQWTEIKADGTVEHGQLTFVNSGSVFTREAAEQYGP